MPTLTFSRNPNLGDTIAIDTKLLARRNLANKIQVFRSRFWNEVDSFRFVVSGLSSTEVESIVTFIRSCSGQEITLVDYYSMEWTGIIVEDPRIEETGPNCQFQISLTFEGSFVTPTS